jgi:hypothetical protein
MFDGRYRTCGDVEGILTFVAKCSVEGGTALGVVEEWEVVQFLSCKVYEL